MGFVEGCYTSIVDCCLLEDNKIMKSAYITVCVMIARKWLLV
jgi:hypothetical protein